MLEYSSAEIISYILFCLVIVPLGLAICRKLYIDTKNEEHKEKGKVIQRIMKNYCLVQCGVWPLSTVMFGIIKFTSFSTFVYNHQALMIIIVSCLRSLLRLNLGYVGFNSFAIATCRYVFIMHITHDGYTSIRKVRKFFVVISVVVPITLWALNETLIPYPDAHLLIVGPPIYADSKPIAQSNLTDVEGMVNSTIDTIEQLSFLIPQSPLFLVVEKHVSTTIISGFKIASYVIQAITYSNIPEGVLYTHLFIVNNR